MPIGDNPLSTGLADLEYSTNGSSWTPFADDEVLNVVPSGRLRKVIERMLLNQTRVRKWTGKINNGTITVTLEYSSPLWVTFNGFFDANTEIYLRSTADDTGGTNGSRHVFQGRLQEIKPPSTPGDDETEQFEITMAVDQYTFTAAL